MLDDESRARLQARADAQRAARGLPPVGKLGGAKRLPVATPEERAAADRRDLIRARLLIGLVLAVCMAAPAVLAALLAG
jgi:hypothetical protein